MLSDNSIIRIISKAATGDTKSEEALYRHFAPQVMKIAWRYAKSDALAQDYMQECFVTMFEKLAKFDVEKGNFEPWLYRLCVNTILQILRKSKQFPDFIELPTEIAEPEIQDRELDLLDKKILLATIKELPPGYMEIFNLNVIDGWSHKDIAQALDITESSSRSQLARAKSLLRQKLYKIIRHHEQRLV